MVCQQMEGGGGSGKQHPAFETEHVRSILRAEGGSGAGRYIIMLST